MPRKLLSTVDDTHGHRIDRYEGNVLEIRSLSGAPVSPDAAREVARWYWHHVGAFDVPTDDHHATERRG